MLGMRRGGFSREAMSAVKSAYKSLFLQGGSLEENVAKLKATQPCKEVQEWIAFIESAGKRGVMRPAVGATETEEASV